MEDFSEVTDLETARHVLIGYDKAFREHAEIHTQMKAEIERLREALEKLSCNCTSNCDWDFDGEICPSWVARAALKGDK